MTELNNNSNNSANSLAGILTFLLMVFSLGLLVIQYIYIGLFDDGIVSINFFENIYYSKIESLNASYLVFLTLLVHITRIQLGITFIQYDRSYLQAGLEMEQDKISVKWRNAFIIFNGVITLTTSTLIISAVHPLVVIVILLIQASIILAYDWFNREPLFRKDIDRKANFLIVVGDLGFLLFVIGIMSFQIFSQMNDDVANSSYSTYFCLISFAVFELLTLVLIMEIIFTYKEGIRLAMRDLKQMILNG